MFREQRKISALLSISIHLILAIIFFFVHFQNEPTLEDYVLIGFGSGGNLGSPSPIGQNEVKESKPVEEKTKQKEIEEKKIELPKSKQKDEENIIKESNRKEKEETPPNKVKPLNQEEAKSRGSELNGEGESGFGFELDFGGKGMRRIYSYILPEYPEGVSKEIDVRLRFTILPDGTVAKIFPLIKADARLESAAINSLRQWRFEPLPSNAKQVEQTVVITFPYRLQ